MSPKGIVHILDIQADNGELARLQGSHYSFHMQGYNCTIY